MGGGYRILDSMCINVCSIYCITWYKNNGNIHKWICDYIYNPMRASVPNTHVYRIQIKLKEKHSKLDRGPLVYSLLSLTYNPLDSLVLLCWTLCRQHINIILQWIIISRYGWQDIYHNHTLSYTQHNSYRRAFRWSNMFLESLVRTAFILNSTY